MISLQDGWVKLHRKLLDKPIWNLSTPEQKVILVTLLLMANHESVKWEWQGKPFKCEPGQFITSIQNIAIKCGNGISIQNVRTALARFEKLEFLTNQSTKTGRLVSIVNWIDYQVEDFKPNKDTNKDLTKSQQRPNKDLTTNKNDKECKNVKNKDNKQFSEDKNLNDALLEFINYRKKTKKPMTDHAVNLLIAKLNKMDPDINNQIAILNQSILMGWQGIFELKGEDKAQKKPLNSKIHNFPERNYSKEDYESMEQKLWRKQNEDK